MIRFSALAAMALMSVPAIAQTLPTPAVSPAPVEKKVCRADDMTGSRMGGRERTCHTVAEWRILDGQAATDESRSMKANIAASRGY